MSGEEEGGFLSRWSARKRRSLRNEPEEQAPQPEEHAAGEAGAEAEAGEAEDASTDPEEQQRLIDSLPDIETLTEDSDFTAFMQKGVPDELRNKALRKLWRMNPIYANLDGLNDYDLDYSDAAMAVGNLKTAYKVGKGYVIEAAKGGEAGPQAASTAPDAAGTTSPAGEAVEDGCTPAEAADAPAADEDEPIAAVSSDNPDKEDEAQTAVRSARTVKRPPGTAPRAAMRRWGLTGGES